jgi:hypothetical protein
MSGGSYNYAYVQVEDMGRTLRKSPDPLRRAFGEHLVRVAKAMHDVEWVDSGDYGDGDEVGAIREVVTIAAELDAAIAAAEEAADRLQAVLLWASAHKAKTP